MSNCSKTSHVWAMRLFSHSLYMLFLQYVVYQLNIEFIISTKNLIICIEQSIYKFTPTGEKPHSSGVE